jgi:hypothetical protein
MKIVARQLLLCIAILSLSSSGQGRVISTTGVSDCHGTKCQSGPVGLSFLERAASLFDAGHNIGLLPRAIIIPKPKVPSPKSPGSDSDDLPNPSTPFDVSNPPDADANPEYLNPEGAIDFDAPIPTGAAPLNPDQPIDFDRPLPTSALAQPAASVPAKASSAATAGSGQTDAGARVAPVPKATAASTNDDGAKACRPGDGSLTKRCSDGEDSEPEPDPARRAIANWYEVIDQPNPAPFKARDALNQRLNSNSPEHDDKPVRQLAPEYVAEAKTVNDVTAERSGLAEILKILNITPRGKGSDFEMRTGDGERPYTIGMSDDGSIAFADYSEGEDDHTAPSKKLRWNELMYSQYKTHMDNMNGGNVGGLRYFGRTTVDSPATKPTIDTAAARTGQFKEDENAFYTFRPDADPSSEMAKAFEAICRTDNVNGVLWLLSDYHNALGNKKITALQWRQKEHGGRMKGDLLIEIGTGE